MGEKREGWETGSIRGEGYGTETGQERERAGGIALKRWEKGEKYGGNYATMLNISQSKKPYKEEVNEKGRVGSREC